MRKKIAIIMLLAATTLAIPASVVSAQNTNEATKESESDTVQDEESSDNTDDTSGMETDNANNDIADAEIDNTNDDISAVNTNEESNDVETDDEEETSELTADDRTETSEPTATPTEKPKNEQPWYHMTFKKILIQLAGAVILFVIPGCYIYFKSKR